jgi:Fe-S-cluster containining protein
VSASIPVRLPDDYPALLGDIDAWQARARAAHPGVIPCRAGCAACCHGPFDISVADALLVRNAVRSLAPADRADIRRRADAQMSRMRAMEPALVPPWDMAALGERRFDPLVEALEHEPCPALDAAGACRIYEQRPMICRLMGLGVRTLRNQVIENGCPIQDDFPEYRRLAPQVFDMDRWDVAQEPLLASAAFELFGTREWSGYETTVAGAVLLDPA